MPASSAEAATNPVPVLTIELDTPISFATVTESTPAIVNVTGRMSIDKLPVDGGVVSLRSSLDIGWVSQLTPTTAVLTSTTPQPFTCTVVVPQGTPRNQTGNLVVKAWTATGGLLCTGETRGIIAVDPFFRCNLSSASPCREIAPGGQAFFTICLTNTGNAMDSFELEITNLRDLSEKRWNVVLSAGTLPKVEPADYKPFRITAQSPMEETLWTSEPAVIAVKITSQNAKDFQQVVSATCQLTVYVRGTHLPSLDLAVPALVLALAAACLAVRTERNPGGRSRHDPR